MEYHLFNIPHTTTNMAGRGSDVAIHAFIAGVIGFLVTAAIYNYTSDSDDSQVKIHKLETELKKAEERIEELETALEEETERAENLGEEVNNLLGLISRVDETLKNYKNKTD
jgi:peptidoglycan hydrolase CwlO-like protein